jgi:hypothetical protein
MQSPLTPSAGLTEKLFEELLTELRTERSSMREQHHELVKERKTERRWKTFFRKRSGRPGGQSELRDVGRRHGQQRLRALTA